MLKIKKGKKMKKVNNPQTSMKERDMMKKGLLALVCLSLLVMVPACKRKGHGESDATVSREHMRHNRKTKRVKVTVKKEKAATKSSKPAKKMNDKKEGGKKRYGKTKQQNEHVGKKLKEEEMNEEDKD